MHEQYKDVGDLLDCLIEECSEVIKAACKIKRFGWLSTHPVTEQQNIDVLRWEMEDVLSRIAQTKAFIDAHFVYSFGRWIGDD